MRNFLAALTFVLIGGSAHAAERTVILTLFDGFAPPMVEATETPALDRMRAEGGATHDLVPAFPTISQINHTTYTTGCWPSEHGIVSNYFEDPVRGRFEGSRDADWRTGCDAIWETVEKAGLKAAVLGFTGNYSTTRGPTATYAPREETWADSPGDEARAQQVIDLLNMEGDDRPQLIAAYFSGPDWTAHWSGTTADKTLAAARASDALIGKIMAAIETLPEDREATLIVAADHGMVDVGPYFNIGRVMRKLHIQGTAITDGANAFIYLDDKADVEEATAKLDAYEMVQAYKNGEYPDYARLGTTGREGDILLVLDQPYWIADPSEFPAWTRRLGLTWFWPETMELSSGIKATHGFPPDDAGMHTILYTWGAGIEAGSELGRVDMIDVVPMAEELLGIE